MTGFRVAMKNIRIKEDPSGRVHIYRVHKKIAGKSRAALEARAKREADKWKAAEHYSPIPPDRKD